MHASESCVHSVVMSSSQDSTGLRRQLRVAAAALSLAVLSAALVALCAPTGGRQDVLFGDRNSDPSMPAPLIGGDDDALQEGSSAWGSVGPGGMFLGRSMSKRPKVISNQRDLWRRAEQGIGNLVAISKGQWHPRPAERDQRDGGAEERSRRGDTYARPGAEERRHDSYYDETRSQRAERHVHGRLHADDGSREISRRDGRQSELHERSRRAADDRREISLDDAIADAGGDDDTLRGPAGHDVTALRNAIVRMKSALGSTKERLEEQVRYDEERERRRRENRRETEDYVPSRTSALATAPMTARHHTANVIAKRDALGHRIEWPLLEHHPQARPSDTDQAAATISDSIDDLKQMVGTVEDDVHGFLAKARDSPQHSNSAMQFRQKWGDVAARALHHGAISLQSSKHS